MRDRPGPACWVRAALPLAGATAAGILVRHWTHRWGATSHEHHQQLPGDDLVASPAIVSTRAVTIDASPDQIWPWLIQIGQNRGGMYSYDWLENLLRLHVHSTHGIRDEWQQLTPGDRVVLVPPGWAGVRDGHSLPVAVIDPPHTLILRQVPPEHAWDAVWTFHIEPTGTGQSRLISRGRSHRQAGLHGLKDLAVDTLMDPVTMVMTRKMLLGIKSRAEAAPEPHLSTHRPVPVRRSG